MIIDNHFHSEYFQIIKPKRLREDQNEERDRHHHSLRRAEKGLSPGVMKLRQAARAKYDGMQGSILSACRRHIPASLAYRDYAAGLTLHQHRVILDNARGPGRGHQSRRAHGGQGLSRRDCGQAARPPRPPKDPGALARYLSTEHSRREVSVVRAPAPDKTANDFLDFRTARPRHAEIKTQADNAVADDMEDLESIRSRKKLEFLQWPNLRFRTFVGGTASDRPQHHGLT